MTQSACRSRRCSWFFRYALFVFWAASTLAAPAAWADTVEVSITGIEDELLTNVRTFLSITKEHEEPWDERRVRRLFRLSRSEIRQALEPFGYYNPSIAATLQPPAGDDADVWQVSYVIEPGPATMVETLTLEVIRCVRRRVFRLIIESKRAVK